MAFVYNTVFISLYVSIKFIKYLTLVSLCRAMSARRGLKRCSGDRQIKVKGNFIQNNPTSISDGFKIEAHISFNRDINNKISHQTNQSSSKAKYSLIKNGRRNFYARINIFN